MYNMTMSVAHVADTVEFRFFELPWATKIGSKNRMLREIEGKIDSDEGFHCL